MELLHNERQKSLESLQYLSVDCNLFESKSRMDVTRIENKRDVLINRVSPIYLITTQLSFLLARVELYCNDKAGMFRQ